MREPSNNPKDRHGARGRAAILRAAESDTTSPSRCICRRPATGQVHSRLLDDTVHITIGTCDLHGPTDEDSAMSLVRALLHGIASLGGDADERFVRSGEVRL